MKMIKTIFCLLALFGSVLLAGEISREHAQAVLDEIYGEIGKRHFDVDFAEKYRKHYLKHQPAILNAPNDGELATALNRMLEDFGDSHLMVQPPLSAAAQEATRQLEVKDGSSAIRPNPPLTGSGIDVLETGEGILIWRVEADSAAAKAGLKSGMAIQHILGYEITPTEGTEWFPIVRQLADMTAPDGLVYMNVSDGAEVTPVQFEAGPVKKQMVHFPGGPSLRGGYYSELRDDGIGYICFDWFTQEMIQLVRRDIRGKLKDAEGLIIDLRGNGGGLFHSIDWLASWTVPQKVTFGSLKITQIPLKLSSTPQPRGFKKKLAVIIDKNTFSSAEIFAAGIQDAGAGKIYGTTSGGQCLPSIFLTLPSGFRLQTIMGEETRSSGERIEKNGVTPDVKIEATAAGLAVGIDGPVEKAAADLLAAAEK
jgi:C-terminal processing protease CtpA/Prc